MRACLRIHQGSDLSNTINLCLCVELQAQMMEMERKDEKRAIILASVLEKTARMQQPAAEQHVSPRGTSLHR